MSVERAIKVIEEEIAKLQTALAALVDDETPKQQTRAYTKAATKKKTTMSPNARKAISVAMKKRWATAKGVKAPKAVQTP